ncbi:Tox-REase-5 domain-containing protein [Mycobacterium sp. PS03-16]|uniref:Tox-REase-5 domain-containing protein n=1 Tax=Mycobacterium sp. PS03-16 TaxID=2559611 RepID=UPI00142F43D1|nr:Tox-REase-5 domain-containing protein [Mycobacterium sp. PS03-16]
MAGAAAAYQRQITGCSPAWDYRVTCGRLQADFDGLRAGILLDAKYFAPNGLFMRAASTLAGRANRMNVRFALRWVHRMLAQARREQEVARRAGLPLEWHVASREATAELARLLACNGINGIRVRYTAPR